VDRERPLQPARARRFLEGLLVFRRNGVREHARLHQLMDERLRALRLPRVLSMARMHDPRGTEVTDLLGVISLLARTSAGDFLADRDPDLTLAEPGLRTTGSSPESPAPSAGTRSPRSGSRSPTSGTPSTTSSPSSSSSRARTKDVAFDPAVDPLHVLDRREFRVREILVKPVDMVSLRVGGGVPVPDETIAQKIRNEVATPTPGEMVMHVHFLPLPQESPSRESWRPRKCEITGSCPRGKRRVLIGYRAVPDWVCAGLEERA